MHPTLSIRIAEPDDLNTIGFLAQQIWPPTYRSILREEQLEYMMNLFYSPASLKKQILEEKHVFVIAEEGNEPLGFASFSNTETAGDFKLHKIYILPGQQGKGIGKAIIDFVIEQVKPMGANRLLLNVNRYNKARIFYERFGFVVTGEEDIHIGRGYYMNDYTMELKIVQPSRTADPVE
jgi:GNAT superfamily N-acetyltransferase